MTPSALRIRVGSDHAAISTRGRIAEYLREQGHTVTEAGPAAGERSDYPDQASDVALAVSRGDVDRGVLVCGTGIGMSIAANKVHGVRAALVHDPFTAEMAAMHNDANVLCLGGRLLAPAYAVQLVDTWLRTPFEARHQARLDKITSLESEGT